jgi:hypothetical protein
MKNKKQTPLVHGIVEFIKRELEMSLALLLMLGFVVGFSYASTTTTPLDNGDIQVADTSAIDTFAINGIQYQGIWFGSGNVANLYSARAGYTGGNDLSQTAQGVTGYTKDTIYSLTIKLSQPISGTYFLHGDYTNVTVGNSIVNSPQGAIQLTGNSVTIRFAGGNTLQKLVPYAGADAKYVAPSVKTLFVIPNTTSLTAGQTRSFAVTAIDDNGNQVQNPSLKWTITSGSEFANIDSNTGLITGIKEGVVKVKVTANGSDASLTITVKEAPKAIIAPITTNKDEDYPGADEKIEPDSASTIDEANPSWYEFVSPKTADNSSTQESVSNALDAFAEAQKEVSNNATTTTTFVNEAKVQEILNTTTSNVIERAVTKITLGVTQIAQDLKEMFVGSTATLEDGTIIKQPSVFQRIGKNIAALFGFGGSTGNTSGASPLDAGLGGGEIIPE